MYISVLFLFYSSCSLRIYIQVYVTVLAVWGQSGMSRRHQGGCVHVGPGWGKGAGERLAGVALTSHFTARFPELAAGSSQRWDFDLRGQEAFVLVPQRHSCVYPHQGSCQALQPHRSSSGKLFTQHGYAVILIFFFHHSFKHYCFCVVCVF